MASTRRHRETLSRWLSDGHLHRPQRQPLPGNRRSEILPPRKVTIELTTDETIKCVLTNNDSSNIEVAKWEDANVIGEWEAPDPRLAGWKFSGIDAGNNALCGRPRDLQNAGCSLGNQVVAGTYKVCEVLQPGWVVGWV